MRKVIKVFNNFIDKVSEEPVPLTKSIVIVANCLPR